MALAFSFAFTLLFHTQSNIMSDVNHEIIVVCGTPGVGKTTFARDLANRLEPNSKHYELSRLVEQNKALLATDEDQFDEERNCSVFDEEKLADYLEDLLINNETVQVVNSNSTGTTTTVVSRQNPNTFYHVLDFHCVSFFDYADELFDSVKLVVHLSASTEELGKRLEKRNYSEQKIRENIEAEIFQVVGEEVDEMFNGDEERKEVVQLENNSLEDMDRNMAMVFEKLGLVSTCAAPASGEVAGAAATRTCGGA
ncbi:unnamed protein product [Amoebophrya sp. A120]|nr:unnamed protein product [Amoebophrya sp. A120]|eukprot:GSA120T00015882001.1